MSDKKSRKNSLNKGLRKNLKSCTCNHGILKGQLKRAEEKLLQYELAFLIHKKLLDEEDLMSNGYNEELFDAQMRSKYKDAKMS